VAPSENVPGEQKKHLPPMNCIPSEHEAHWSAEIAPVMKVDLESAHLAHDVELLEP
jgi:hypothetical protein